MRARRRSSIFRWFAALPALETSDADGRCHWFVDLRFRSPGRDVMPLRFGACRDSPQAPWLAYERDERGEPIPLD